MKTQRHIRGQKNANRRLSRDLTEEFRERIEALRPSPKSDWLKAEIFTKFLSNETDPPPLRRERAIEKWLATEERNEETRQRFENTPGDYNILPRVPLKRFTEFCCDVIRDIIGETPPLEALIGSFSGGASTSRNRTSSHPAGKYLGEAHATARALEWFIDLHDELPLWFNRRSSLLIGTVPGNVMFTVPKKTDIDRVACKEPDINMWLQKGCGTYIRRQLRRININLNDQSINSSLAQQGSHDGSLATMDLSSASDSVSSALVELLLPVCWYTLLDSIRSHVTNIPRGKFVEVHRNEMFSSMGNGFTFELESLLFYVLARATAYFTGTSGIVSIYGDDIICPSAMYEDLETVLRFFGFEVNTKKSFASGPFRESCGGHYWNGFDITPFYVRRPITTVLDAIHVANGLRAWAGRGTVLNVLDPEVEDTWYWLKSFIPYTLWGGSDTASTQQLVSSDVSSHRLVPESRKRAAGEGGYLLWHNATKDRNGDFWEGVETSFLTTATKRHRIRPVRKPTVPRLPQVFLREI